MHRFQLRIASSIHEFNFKLDFNFEINLKLTNINSNYNTQLNEFSSFDKVSTKKIQKI